MPKWLEISLYTFSFYCVLFVCWMLLVLPLEGDTDISKLLLKPDITYEFSLKS